MNRLINRTKTLKPQQLLIILVATTLILLSIFAFFSQPQAPTPPSSSDVPNYDQLPQEIIQEKRPLTQQPQPLQIINITPPDEVIKTTSSIVSLTIELNHFIDPNTIQVSTNPQTQIDIITPSQTPKTFNIVPINGWQFDTPYQITISKNLTSTQGLTLETDQVFSVSFTQVPIDPPSVGY